MTCWFGEWCHRVNGASVMGERTESYGEEQGQGQQLQRRSERSKEEGSKYVHLATDRQAAREARHLPISLSYGSV